MGHAEHYLRRIDRLGAAHAELALSLYRDHELVAHLLRFEKLPDSAERIAISLDDPVEGPFVIVTRDGHFVTCLGAGMRPRKDQPVLKRVQLDRLAGELESLRALVDRSESGRLHETARLLASLDSCGSGLGREQFRDLARWTPLLGTRFFASFLKAGLASAELYQRLSRTRDPAHRRHEDDLRSYWEKVWAIGHYALLVGSDSGKTLTRLMSPPVVPEDMPDSALVLPAQLGTSTALTPFALRTAWLMAQAPAASVGPLKRQLTAAADLPSVLESGLPLLAIGARSSRHRAEIGKVFARTVSSDDARTQELLRALRDLFAEFNRHADSVREGMVDNTHLVARELLREMGEDFAPGQAPWGQPDAVPNDVLMALQLTIFFPLDGEGRTLLHAMEQLVATSRSSAEDFYLPETHLPLIHRPWTPEDSMELLQPRLDADGSARFAGTVARSTKVGRNAPCPCGSGKKHKHCCANPARD